MNTFGLFLVFAILFSKYYCSTESNTVNQPLSLLKSVLISKAKWQMKHFLVREPFVAYNKLNNGILEMFGTAFDKEVTKEKIEFLQELISNFNIQSVTFKVFHFSEKMLNIFDIFQEKLQHSVKSVIFDTCYFPNELKITSTLELMHVTECSFSQCFANEDVLKKIFKIFKNAPVSSLTILHPFDNSQFDSAKTNIEFKLLRLRDEEQKLLKISELELNLFFPNVQFLSLSCCKLDFNYFDLTSLKNLNEVNLSESEFKNFREKKFLKRFPAGLKSIKTNYKPYHEHLSFIENVFEKKLIINSSNFYEYDKSNGAIALSVFSSIDFNMNSMYTEVDGIKDYAQSSGGVLNGVTRILTHMIFNRQNVTSLMKLLVCFPNLNNIIIEFNGNCDSSLNSDEVHEMLSVLPIVKMEKIEKLSIIFKQSGETSAFYRFVIGLMKICEKMSALEFVYEKSNLFAMNVKKLIDTENIQFPNLNTFIVHYYYINPTNDMDGCIFSDGAEDSDDSVDSNIIDASIDLLYITEYNIKNLTMDASHSDLNSKKNLNVLDQFEFSSVTNLTLRAAYFENVEPVFIKKLATKFPNVSNIVFDGCPGPVFSTKILGKMKMLKDITTTEYFPGKAFNKLLKALPLDLESLHVVCFSEEIESTQMYFYKKFPISTLIL